MSKVNEYLEYLRSIAGAEYLVDMMKMPKCEWGFVDRDGHLQLTTSLVLGRDALDFAQWIVDTYGEEEDEQGK
jgi:hypothetical protein